MSKSLTITLISFIVACICSVFLVDKNYLQEFYFTFVSIITGVIIAVVGIFLGSISILINSFTAQLREKLIDGETFNFLIGKLQTCKKEIKDNLLAIIIFYLVGAFFFFLQKIDIPNVAWPIKDSITFLSKINMLNYCIIATICLIVYTIIDSIEAMFLIDKEPLPPIQ